MQNPKTLRSWDPQLQGSSTRKMRLQQWWRGRTGRLILANFSEFTHGAGHPDLSEPERNLCRPKTGLVQVLRRFCCRQVGTGSEER